MNKMPESNQDTLNANASTDTLVCAFVVSEQMTFTFYSSIFY